MVSMNLNNVMSLKIEQYGRDEQNGGDEKERVR